MKTLFPVQPGSRGWERGYAVVGRAGVSCQPVHGMNLRWGKGMEPGGWQGLQAGWGSLGSQGGGFLGHRVAVAAELRPNQTTPHPWQNLRHGAVVH